MTPPRERFLPSGDGAGHYPDSGTATPIGAGLALVFAFGDVLWKAVGNGYMLVLTLSAATLVLGLHWNSREGARGLRGLGWLRSLGRLSYEVYLSHMFVVFAAVGLYRMLGADVRAGAWWYPAVVLACWALGALWARTYSIPCERALRGQGRATTSPSGDTPFSSKASTET